MTRRGDRGFTLVEMILVVVVSAVVMGAMLEVGFVGLRTLDNTNAKLAGSNDTQLIASYLMSDVASAEFVSTTGTREHTAPSVNGANNGMLVSFFAVKTATTMTPPDGMSQAWSSSSAGTSGSTRVTAAMADQQLSATASTGNRVAKSTTGTSSITHALALTPSLVGTVSRRDFAVGTKPGPTSLRISRPPLTQNGDLLIAHIVVASATTTVTVSNGGWGTPVSSQSVDSDGGLTSRVYKHTAAAGDPAYWDFSFSGPLESAGGMAAYASASDVSANSWDLNPCGGATPALLVDWTDRFDDTAHEVTYNSVQSGGETQLVRRHCVGTSGTPVNSQTLARQLAVTGAVAGECQPVTCGPMTSPVTVTLTLQEAVPPTESVGRVYQLRGTTRANG